MNLVSVLVLAGILIAVFAFFYKLYEILWDAIKIPLKKPRMKLDLGRRIYILIRNVFLQGKLFKDPFAGIMHALMFWGFIVFGRRARCIGTERSCGRNPTASKAQSLPDAVAAAAA
uniref:hypothetical protein n=1 Tax=Metallibacterium scheffleri TaxID=993689 RepID=UPI0023F540DC